MSRINDYDVHLIGLDAIASTFRVGKARVRRWIRAGAPIARIGRNWQSNYFELWNWLSAHARKP